MMEAVLTSNQYHDYLCMIKQFPILSQEEEKNYFKLLEKGNQEAKIILFNSNLRLVIYIANKYHTNSCDVMDLIQEGNIGLLEAIDEFDYKKGYRFSTYATPKIRSKIKLGLANSTTNTLTLYQINEITELNKAIKILEQKNGQTPTITELAIYLKKTETRIKNAFLWQEQQLSIDKECGEHKTSHFSDSIIGETELDKGIIAKELVSQVEYLLNHSKLSPTQIEIIKMRFGFKTNEPMYQTEIARALGLTNQAINHAEKMAIQKLRRSKHRYPLAEYIGSAKTLNKKNLENLKYSNRSLETLCLMSSKKNRK